MKTKAHTVDSRWSKPSQLWLSKSRLGRQAVVIACHSNLSQLVTEEARSI